MTDKTVTPAPKKATTPKTTPARATRAQATAPGKVVPPTPAKSPKTEVKKEKKLKPTKMKVIRDSFTLPQDDYAKIAELKHACLKAGLHVKKSELIRAGLRLLSKLDEAQLHAEMSALEKIKTGRPKST